MSVDDSYFERLFQESDDPWAFKKRWYERRKRALTLAALPRERYASVFEPGCANGELSADLATRCDRLLVCDTNRSAVELARQRLATFTQVEVMHGRLPEQWPDGRFDLIVFSELGYYLDEQDLNSWIDRALASLTDDGQVLACHWRPQIDGCPMDAQKVHAILAARLEMPRIFSHEEADFFLDVWSRDERSVAERENLR
ncbi:putative methyltransferase [Pseudomonas savastanoi pv. glycinea]|uniref:Nodulation S family protein n=1 Tax=Pseudomonas phytophila TaxID=2867264 RepID=A0ABY6F7Y0_9PSED|nr:MULTISPECIES: SAM-dependent methyltransferase [Pseudomonas]MCD5990772.1 methyltransferase domain-containing protein [Pseudomonas quasicaspiana]PHN26290.1 methyltransferase [Pseudomonas sp. ICMP 561]RMR04940.1 putative methyltransferase [Pseudomonas savastanoi pv. glycinea]UXZ93982.1 nodulation S family protein [Pseudomonas phytophila]